MIANIFSKSKPINFIFLTSAFVLCFILFQLKDVNQTNSTFGFLEKIAILIFLIVSAFIINLIAKRNNLTKDNCFSFLFFLIFLLLFSDVLNNINVVVANFFVLLALKRLILLQSLVRPKEKIFDASFWIFIGTLFHFCSVFFIILVFVSIIFHASQDYRNWVVPFIALFTVAIIYTFVVLLIDDKFPVIELVDQVHIGFSSDYFKNGFQNIELVFFTIIALFFLINKLFPFSKKLINLHASHKKIICAFFIGTLIFLISANKNNSYLIYTLAPLAIMGSNYTEKISNVWIKEMVLYIIIGVSLMVFLFQL